MKPLRVFIADDEPLGLQRIETLFRAMPGIDVVGTADNGTDAIEAIEALMPDIAVLDIEMPGASGLQIAAMLPEETRPEIVFVTAYGNFAAEAYTVDAADYVLKPAQLDRLTVAIERARRRRNMRDAGFAAPKNALTVQPRNGAQSRGLWVHMRGSATLVPLPNINWVEAQGEYALLHTDTRSYMMRTSMRALGERFEGTGIVRVHRSAFVRLSKVTEVRKIGKTITELVLDDGAMVPVGPSYAARVSDQLCLLS